MGTASARQVVEVQREKLIACMTCPLCNYLFTDATTISECLHTFCRNCIYEKITGDELDCCPVCNINLGCVPLEKLRADHNMEDLREKIFPCKRKKVKAPEMVSSVSVALPAKRKERSLSSLVISELHTATHPGMITMSTVQKKLTSQQSPPTKLVLVQNKENNAEVIEREIENSNQRIIQVVDEARSNYCSIQDTTAKSNPIHIDNDKKYIHKLQPDFQEHGCRPELDRLENGFSETSVSVEHGKLPDVHSTTSSAGTDRSYVQTNSDIDASSRRRSASSPIWFSLVASDCQEGDEPLSQISSSYLRVRDGSLPVSFIQKYLMKKLDLASETEVEISLKGKPVSSKSCLQDLLDLWRHTTSKIERIQTSVGSSAKDFVMVLSYGRKADPHQQFTKVCSLQ